MTKRIAFICSVESAKLSDAHIFKDLCLVPILLGEHLGYEVSIVTTEMNETLLQQSFPAVKFEQVPIGIDYVANMNAYLVKHAKNIDLVFAIGPYPSYLSILQTYKQFNPNGKVYMKLDVNRFWLSRLKTYPYFLELLQLCDLLTSECVSIQTDIREFSQLDVQHIPNGFYEYFHTEPVQFHEKKNRILSVGRLDAPEKQTIFTIKAFLAAQLTDWELRLVGPMSESFQQEIKQLLDSHPYPAQVTMVGPISDKMQLEEEYRKAKIFCLTSTVECFAHVFAEAAKNGCYIVTTDVDGAADITQQQRFGRIHPTHDWESIARTLQQVAHQEALLENTCLQLQADARKELNWQHIVKDVAAYLNEKK
ncbi:glycosyltransferase [Lysinibacillus fusiformis]|uniref:glycosyltransferase n=1 Tax=Lysinibacillus fusiformis TaxID=28031 RepID=UPI001E369364|nr:glycosyltransferase [Lysinibacillus fusiformis]MCE4044281.1 glycosyltransferase [Lysinibacillus fusiformis]